MEERRRGLLSGAGGSGVQDGRDDLGHGVLLLHCPHQSGRADKEGGTDRRGNLCIPPVDWDIFRRSPDSPQPGSRPLSLPSGVSKQRQQRRDRRLSRPRSPRKAVTARKGTRGLGHQPGGSQERRWSRTRRTRGSSTARRRLRASSCSTGSGPCRLGRGGRAREQGVQEEEEEGKEVEEGKICREEEAQWKEPSQCMWQGPSSSIRGDWIGLQGEGAQPGLEESKALCVQERPGGVKQLRELEQFFFKCDRRELSAGRSLCRELEGPRSLRAVSWDPHPGGLEDHERISPDRGGRKLRGSRPPTHRPPVLQTATPKEVQRAGPSGASYSEHGVGSRASWPGQSGQRCPGAEDQITRSGSLWNPLAGGSEDGGMPTRPGHGGPPSGTATSAEGELPGCQNDLPGKTPREGRRLQREGRKGREGRSERRQEGRRRKGQRKATGWRKEGRRQVVSLEVEKKKGDYEEAPPDGEPSGAAAPGRFVGGFEDESFPIEDGLGPSTEDPPSCLVSGEDPEVGSGAATPTLVGEAAPLRGDVSRKDQPEFQEAGPPFDRAGLVQVAGSISSTTSGRLSMAPKSDEGHPQCEGLSFPRVGHFIFQKLLEVLPLRSLTTGEGNTLSVFPLPTSKSLLKDVAPNLNDDGISWLSCLVVGLNSFWGGDLFYDGVVSSSQKACLRMLSGDVGRVCKLSGILPSFDWGSFFKTRSVDYLGDEVKVAQYFSWKNVSPALPEEVGRVPLADVCTMGAKHYVMNFGDFIKPREEWDLKKAPKVMVEDSDWAEVCQGLVKSGVCTLLHKDEVFDLGDGQVLLNGLFGVSKDEVSNGVEVFRLIMNLIPLNALCQPMCGDIATLPTWGGMNPFFLQPHENLLISSEDVRCFFYTMSVPPEWYKFLAFNKKVPSEVLPAHMVGSEVFLAAKVLPMGFLNSVSLAQHVHRNLVLWSGSRRDSCNLPHEEQRKDKSFSVANPSWRVYLDNFDLLEKVEATSMVQLEGSCPAGVLALRGEYEYWEVPRNFKKAVSRQPTAEVQGAQVDGVLGVAYPRESKLLKYIAAGLKLISQYQVTQREVQVVCGGLVYVSMFRRPLLGCLNAVWRFVESFKQGIRYQVFPSECKFEVLRFMGLVPLARLNFRLEVHPQVTCSDASGHGGGICVSQGLTPVGVLASGGELRGVEPELCADGRVLCVGLFDGIGALRVALDLLSVEVGGYISVESNSHAARVVESHFPSVVRVEDVEHVTDALVHQWSMTFSQTILVLLGAGPPCQGVSGLNADRKGALKDARSSLFFHVKRTEKLFKRRFPWAQVHTLMENVASMDSEDMEHMSDDFGSYPWLCDAGTLTWCSRPRYYWISWGLDTQSGVTIHESQSGPGKVELRGEQDLLTVCKEGWIKVDCSRPFPTFTTSRPRSSPGRKPAGIQQCSDQEISRWTQDNFRFPPYQYMGSNCLINRRNELRLPQVEEKEMMLGFPVGYTAPCCVKSKRNTKETEDLRHTLLGNSWSVVVISWFLAQLLAPRGLCQAQDPQSLLDLLQPGSHKLLQDRLLRLPLQPLRGAARDGGEAKVLATNFTNLLSIKGEDIMVVGGGADQVKFHRLRASVPSKLWKWKVVTGWRWTSQHEHINVLEMRAILTSLRWRIVHQGHVNTKFIHLTDSLVCLHSLSRGRSSSRKLRRTICRINALLLASGNHALWGYVHTDQNPADRPSRWGRKVRTKFRNG